GQVVAAEADAEVAGPEQPAGELPAAGAPVADLLDRPEGLLADLELAAQAVGAARPGLLGRVVDDLADGVAEQLRPGPGPGAAEEVEREDDDGGSHGSGERGVPRPASLHRSRAREGRRQSAPRVGDYRVRVRGSRVPVAERRLRSWSSWRSTRGAYAPRSPGI